MQVALNGNIVAEEQGLISVFDRGFLYGDGLFETMRIADGKPFRWKEHWQRLEQGAQLLKILLPLSQWQTRKLADELIDRNQMPEALLRLTFSRGVGLRGYSPKGAEHPTSVMMMHPAPGIDPDRPPQWRLSMASPRLPAKELLAQYKTCNKLAQVLARAEADAAGADEALLLNTDGFVVEGASSNLFWIDGERVCTPPLLSGILAGITRSVVRELCPGLGLEFCEREIQPSELARQDGVFLSLSSVGIAEALAVDGQSTNRSPHTVRLSRAYWELVRR
jgi:branched-chain amino acid aminotransferase